MAYNPINPTQLTPPRVAFIDERSGAISREWYRFFLSLVTSAQNSQDAADTGPDANSLLATYDAMLASVAQETQTNTSDLTASLQQQINDVFTESSTQPRAELGTMASVQQDNVRFLGFATSPSPPVVSAPGVVAWNNADGTLDIGMGYDGVTQQVGLEQYFRIKASATITNGQCIMFTGSVGASGVLKGAPATGVTNPQYIMGVATMDIANNGFGYVTSFGLVRGINTTGSSVGETWADGDILYYNPAFAGGLTNVPPTAPTPKIVVASVVNAGAGGSGSLFIRIQGEPDLHNLSDVYAPSPISNGQILIGDGPQSRWESATLTAGSGVSIANGAGSITISATGSGGTVTSVSVVSANGLAGTVANATTTPAITLSTTVSGLVKGNGAALSAAIAGTDYVAPGAITTSGLTMATARLLGRTTASTGAVEELSVAGGLTLTGGVLTGASGTVTSVSGTGTVNGITLTGTVTSSGSLTLGGTLSGVSLTTQVTGTLPIANGGTGATTAATARTALGATTVGGNVFTLTNPSAITFPRFNADNTVSALDAASFRTAIGAGTGSGTVTSVSGTGTVNGITLTGTVTSSGSLTLGGTLSNVSLTSQVTGTLPVTNGGTGTATAFTTGSVVFANASGIYAQDNTNFFWDNTNKRLGIGTAVPSSVLQLNKAAGAVDMRLSVGGTLYGNVYASASDTTITSVTAIPLILGTDSTTRFQVGPVGQFGIGGATYGTAGQVLTSGGALAAPTWATPTTGTVTSVSGTGTVSGLTLTGTVTTSGSLTLGGTLAVTASNFSSQTANTFLAAPNGSAGVPTFRAIVAADVPTLNQNTTGTASNVTGTVAIANGGTGATTAPLARTALGATTVGSNVFTLTNPSAITFPRFNADNTVSALDAATFRTAIGAGTSSTTGTVTSVSGTGTVNGITLTGTVTSSGSLTLGGTLSGVSLTTQVSGTLPVGNGGTGATTFTANALLKGNTTSAVSASNVSDNGSTVSIGSGIGFSVARTAVTAPAAADGNVFSGTYTPTSFNTTNIAASTPQSAQYLRVGNTVTVSGQIDIDPTATGFAILGLSLPVASAITSAVQLSGVFNCPDAVGGGIYGDATNDRATFQFTASSAANLTYYYTFTYRVL